jgi:hypothetical protein
MVAHDPMELQTRVATIHLQERDGVAIRLARQMGGGREKEAPMTPPRDWSKASRAALERVAEAADKVMDARWPKEGHLQKVLAALDAALYAALDAARGEEEK